MDEPSQQVCCIAPVEPSQPRLTRLQVHLIEEEVKMRVAHEVEVGRSVRI